MWLRTSRNMWAIGNVTRAIVRVKTYWHCALHAEQLETQSPAPSRTTERQGSSELLRSAEACPWSRSRRAQSPSGRAQTPAAAGVELLCRVSNPRSKYAFRHLLSGCTKDAPTRMYIDDSAISADTLLELCRACPQLKNFRTDSPCVTRENLREFCVEVSRACPRLEYASPSLLS